MKLIGIVGALSLLPKLMPSDYPVQDDFQESKRWKTAVQILNMVQEHCKNWPRCFAIALDEMALMVSQRKINVELSYYINENWAENQIEMFSIDKKSAKTFDEEENWKEMKAEGNFGSVSVRFDLSANDGDDDDATFVIYPNLSDPSNQKQNSRKNIGIPTNSYVQHPHRIILMCSMFNFMQAFHYQRDGSLSEFNAPLGFSILLFDKKEAEEMRLTMSAKMRENICSALFYAINWFRELINAYTPRGNEGYSEAEYSDATGNVLVRLSQILELEKELEEWIFPGWIPTGIMEDGGAQNFISYKSNTEIRSTNSETTLEASVRIFHIF
ncbi:Fanconi anemia group D2 protein [Nowakowskiella sp. JEL0078]|nr:Fanconi anemia group D2 protein [Nowakowskiella sp. JEL0078]